MIRPPAPGVLVAVEYRFERAERLLLWLFLTAFTCPTWHNDTRDTL